MTDPTPSSIADERIGQLLDYLDWRARQADRETRPTLEGYAAAVRALVAVSVPRPYRDSTPHLHVGDSSFEGWMGCHEPDRRDGRRAAFTKQDMRDAYAAGMGDPLVVARAAAPKCAMCNGQGLVGYPTGHPDASAETCPDCEGTGCAPTPTFQMRIDPWLLACFGETISRDRVERNHRFLEEALELVQAGGCTASEAHQLVDYTFGRPVGELQQEVGGVMVTLAALCLAHDADMHTAGETELVRIWTKVEKIRAKQAAKPKHSPLPEVAPPGDDEPYAWFWTDGSDNGCLHLRQDYERHKANYPRMTFVPVYTRAGIR